LTSASTIFPRMGCFSVGAVFALDAIASPQRYSCRPRKYIVPGRFVNGLEDKMSPTRAHPTPLWLVQALLPAIKEQTQILDASQFVFVGAETRARQSPAEHTPRR
jgi:hypothetical protein